MRRLFLLTLMIGGLLAGSTVHGDETGAWFDAHAAELVKVYEHFHAHPNCRSMRKRPQPGSRRSCELPGLRSRRMLEGMGSSGC